MIAFGGALLGAWLGGMSLPADRDAHSPGWRAADLPNEDIAFDPRAHDVVLAAQAEGVGAVRLRWRSQAFATEMHLYRSTSPLPDDAVALATGVDLPITCLTPGAVSSVNWLDRDVADGVAYHYRLVVGPGAHVSDDVTAETPGRQLPALNAPALVIDKRQFTLAVWERGRLVKRYPVALGRDPVRRKLHFDNATTPEGRFRIVAVQPHATYYKAYDLDYPTPLDRFRYQFAANSGLLQANNGFSPPIGGEVQIHGGGITANWTYGCIALRNDDIDELFRQTDLRSGAAVTITGHDLTLADVAEPAPEEVKEIQRALARHGFSPGPADGRLADATRAALARFQLALHLPLTCAPDTRTRRALQAYSAP